MGKMMDKMKYYLGKFGKLMLLLAPVFLISIQHLAADPPANGDIGEAEKTDLDTGAIEPPDNVRNNPDLIYVLELLLRAPVSQLKDGEPPYDQQPPDAQQDFRTRTNPPPVIPTEPPVVPTEPPVIPTEPPVMPTEPPVIQSPPPNPPPFKRPRPIRPPNIPPDDVPNDTPNTPPNDIN